jgi:hypothetical protein
VRNTGGKEATVAVAVVAVCDEDKLAETLLLSAAAIRPGKGALSGSSLLCAAAAAAAVVAHLCREEILTLGDVR